MIEEWDREKIVSSRYHINWLFNIQTFNLLVDLFQDVLKLWSMNDKVKIWREE